MYIALLHTSKYLSLSILPPAWYVPGATVVGFVGTVGFVGFGVVGLVGTVGFVGYLKTDKWISENNE